MEFDFLPNLPKSDLDDRTYKDLVDECILRIPRYCPEWSNFNPSDPGITLIELFAWLTDQMLLRFNQVPRRNYVAFLELLGIRLKAPTPAKTQITFYLSRPQSHAEPILPVLSGTEVATERTEADEAVIFSTDKVLQVGVPLIRYCLSAENADAAETDALLLRDRFNNVWTQDDSTGHWSGPEQSIFQPYPQLGNCLYLVFDEAEPLDGNVIMLRIEGEPAGSTGINPDHPPRFWEAWDGRRWQSVLLAEADDESRGFSFSAAGQAETVGTQKASIRLHLPIQWPARTTGRYRGRWLRCRYAQTARSQDEYNRSPKLTALFADAVGGTTIASQCTSVIDELVGESNGKPGQKMQLLSGAILPRHENEYLLILPPGEDIEQKWIEVEDFSESGPEDRHYVLDSLTGEIQFGPSIREPTHLAREVELRRQVQQLERTPGGLAATKLLERQHCAIPPRGAAVRISTYRTGGGRRGNVQPRTVRILKSAVPYVAQVTNLQPAFDGADAESLDEAVIRVPSLLRTRDRAVTPEDFETLTGQADRAVARAYCPKEQARGQVRVLVVPKAESSLIEEELLGTEPEQFQLTKALRKRVLDFLDERRILGIEVLLEEPNYVGVSVQAEVGIAPHYSTPRAEQKILTEVRSRLYRFLHPLTGGLDQTGWKFGMPAYRSDIIGLLQSVPGVQYLGAVELYALRRQGELWTKENVSNGIIDPGSLGLICSWSDLAIQSGHNIRPVRRSDNMRERA
ncbi:putative baseplate assembly protein [cf. Phormidesmis sp. LEGE 11477]|uniref:putative baseplate assembly protein n=1 Tax=cf. Phormidesmis sp. LEGE 11477 TaxID=1828680 RepID=UPI001881916B|nr:putative baseplate assembly protein [cf. Phormidesmis sp. LEGE 11477]MBE9060433.1 putative baseplate assembly protein [cf. Phormidesmis sp. LEGE 11477]